MTARIPNIIFFHPKARLPQILKLEICTQKDK